MPASLRLAERLGGNKDLASLQRELDSLRAYRDTLHDTMKGLVEHSQARLKPADVPELVASLKCVAAALTNEHSAAVQEFAYELEAARAEAARQQERAEKAEARAQGNASAKDDAASVVAQLLRRAEEQRDTALRELNEQRVARRAADRAAKAFEAEAAALEAALTRSAARSEQRTVEAVDKALALADAAAGRAAHLEKACHALEQAASEAHAATAAMHAQCMRAEVSSETEVAAEAALSAAHEQAQKDRRLAGQQRDGWQAEAARAAIERTHLREEIKLLEQQLQLLQQVEPPPPPPQQQQPREPGPSRSRFARYVDSLNECKASKEASPRDAARHAAALMDRGARDLVRDLVLTAAGGCTAPVSLRSPSRPDSEVNGVMRSARERGGPLLQSGPPRPREDRGARGTVI
jgi:hypothetical protein